MAESPALFDQARRWRLRRAEKRLRDEAWRVKTWGYRGVYPSEIDKSQARYHRLIRRVYRLGGEPLDVEDVRAYHVTDALPEAYEHRTDAVGDWEVVRVA